MLSVLHFEMCSGIQEFYAFLDIVSFAQNVSFWAQELNHYISFFDIKFENKLLSVKWVFLTPTPPLIHVQIAYGSVSWNQKLSEYVSIWAQKSEAAETDVMGQFLRPETDIMGEIYFMLFGPILMPLICLNLVTNSLECQNLLLTGSLPYKN